MNDEKIPENREMGSEKQRGSSRKRIGLIILALFLVATGFLAGWYGRYGAIDPRMRRLMWALETTEKNFYDEDAVDGLYDDLFDALRPDDYSRYYSAAEYEDVVRESKGQSAGIGVTLLSGADKSVQLFSVTGNSPADLAGLKKGMFVYGYGYDENDLQHGSATEFRDFVTNSTGTFVVFCGYDEKSAALYSIERREFAATYCFYRDSEGAFAFRGEKGKDLTDVTGSYGVLEGADDKTSYVRIDSFTANVAEEFRLCLEKMRERGRTNLVLDLRSNGGGYMDRLTKIASYLMKDAEKIKPVVAIARYRKGKIETFVAQTSDYSAYFGASTRVKILADEDTASASEALIGAMLDYGTVGYGDIYLRSESGKTYGKGIMQSHYEDGQGNVMKLTVATIHWPRTNTCIQGVGVRVEDGAVAVDAPLVWGADDAMLKAALA